MGTTSLAFHPTGKRLASASLVQTVCLWDLESGRLAAELKGHQDLVTCVAYSPDGRTLAAVAWTEADLRGLGRMEQAGKAGELLAQRAQAAGVQTAVFDRGGYQYHGRVKALADGVREGGLTV